MEWVQFPSGKKVCRCHYSQICPSNPTAGTHTPSFPMETSKSKNDVSKKFNGSSTVKHGKKTASQSIKERFHNYRVSFSAVVDWDLVDVPIKHFGRTRFKQLGFSKAIVQVFERSILIILRSSSEIKGLNVKEAKLLSDSIIDEVLPQLPKCIKVFDRRVKALHNAFMNHPTAKHNVTVMINGEKRLISDNSHGVSEFEAVHPKFAVSDSEALEQDNAALIDKGLSRGFLAHSIDVLIKDREYYAQNLKDHVLAIRQLAFLIKRGIRK